MPFRAVAHDGSWRQSRAASRSPVPCRRPARPRRPPPAAVRSRADRIRRRWSSCTRPRAAAAARRPTAGSARRCVRRRPARWRWRFTSTTGTGWAGTTALRAAAFTERQYDAMRANRARFVYTPQVLLQGRDWIGYRADAASSLAAVRARPARAAITLAAVSREGTIAIDATTTVGAPSDRADARLFVALVDSGHVSDVKAGENTGVRLVHDHVVRAISAPQAAGATTSLGAAVARRARQRTRAGGVRPAQRQRRRAAGAAAAARCAGLRRGPLSREPGAAAGAGPAATTAGAPARATDRRAVSARPARARRSCTSPPPTTAAAA